MMERIERRSKGRNWRKVITYFLTCCLFLNTSLPVILADAVPDMIEGEAVLQGSASFNTAGDITTITTGGASTIIEYTRFNIDDLKTVNFAQPDASSAVLNRVIEANQSLINGDLLSNGRVFLVNPAGIIFSGDSAVYVTQLVASGLGMTNKVFNDLIAEPDINKMEFLEGDGEVISRAKITANSVFLIGKKVWNISSISAKDGLVVMAAGDEVRLFQDGSNVSVVVDSKGDGFVYPDIRNSGNVDVLNGKIVLAAGDTLSRAIYMASYLTAQGGTVEVQAALVKSKGRIDVSAYPADEDGDGGSISLTGVDKVIISPSVFDDPGCLAADAGVNGNGGTITINAPGTDTVEGKVTIEKNTLITATGGSVSGDGGSVTITCDDFEIAGEIDASFG
ncbi:MAG TPA: filamentous hemagglutinin N-terminal domain-containing protein, partial [Sedimentisphaerales bacterium]|nr:filamentous hemagglutinin N-terminal domain-containing protein [Sedimentisphaerales bacterium]